MVTQFKIMNDLTAHLSLSDKVLDKDSITNWISYSKWINDSMDLERAKSKQFLLRHELEIRPEGRFDKEERCFRASGVVI